MMIYALAFILVLFPRITSGDTCAFENCPAVKPDVLNVHLVCHTHDDSGWLKTVDQYYWGANNSITSQAVQYILNTLFMSLAKNPERKFTYCESNFFWRWWRQQTDSTKQQVLEILNRGQLEFVGGGWVQHDEGCSHYYGLIDHMTIGHRFLNETLGRCAIPTIGWQIDTYGHSRESALLMAQMGFDALFFSRIHYEDRIERWASKSMEMHWKCSDDLPNNSSIFAGVFFKSYSAPAGFCFDDSCGDDPIMDDPELEGYNVDEKVALFIATVRNQAKYYATNNIMLTMGDDFNYRNAERYFENLDKLIKYVNAAAQKNNTKVNVFYSTPSCYYKALMDSGYKFPNKDDEFLPLADGEHSYWTGYYTSRPAMKYFVRVANGLLQMCQSILTIGQVKTTKSNNIDNFHRTFGILQDHGVLPGTDREHVTFDDEKQMYKGIMDCQKTTNVALNKLAAKTDETLPYNNFCTLMNITVCNVTQALDKFVVTVYNGMPRQLRTFARIPVSGNDYEVIDPSGNEIQPQMVKTFFTDQITYVNRSAYQLIFPVTIPPLGYNTYHVSSKTLLYARAKTYSKKIYKKPHLDVKCTDCTMSNNLVTITFDPATGLLSSMADITSGVKTNLTQNFFWYRGTDPTMPGNQASGAYIFRPYNDELYNVGTNLTLQRIGKHGDYVQEMRQLFGPSISQIVRLYQGKPYVEFEWTVGPIPCSDGISREIITRYDSDIQNNRTFYTDSNGRQIMTRILNYQPSYTYQPGEPIASNYYPINSRIFIQDSSKQMIILTDRSEGGSSLSNGSIEIMVHRRDLYDDGLGLVEPLNESGADGRGLIVTGRHWLMLSKPDNGARRYRTYAQEMFYQPMFTFAPMDSSFTEYSQNFKTTFTGLTKPLPNNVNILTLSQWNGQTNLLIRLEHLYQTNEDAELSKPVTVNLKGLFTTFDVQSITETSLTLLKVNQSSTSTSDFTVTLHPMEIRTYLVQVTKNTLEQK